MSSKRFDVVRRYEDVGAQVLALESSRDSSAKIRAILHADGTGSVQFCDPYTSYDSSQQVEVVRSFLQDLAYDDGGYLVHAAAKFWVRNNLGSLAVFPQQCSTYALYEMLQEHPGQQSWKRHESNHAFVIPKTSPGSNNTSVKLYGSVLARRIFRGGGPFLLPDSPALTRSVLRRLGYLDDDLNTDVREAMLVFVNMSDNKYPGGSKYPEFIAKADGHPISGP